METEAKNRNRLQGKKRNREITEFLQTERHRAREKADDIHPLKMMEKKNR